MFNLKRILLLGFVIIHLHVCSSNCQAHRLGETYLFLHVLSDTIEGTVELHAEDADDAFDLDQDNDGKVSREEVDRGIETVIKYLRSRFEITADGNRLELSFDNNATLQKLSIGTYIKIHFSSAKLSIPDQIEIRYEVLFDKDENQNGLLIVERNERLKVVNNDETVSLVFGPDEAFQTLDLTQPPRKGTFVHFVKEGSWHIWIGLDHILFLVALLLPAVMRREDGALEPVSTLKPALWNAIKIATVFTVAHSVTLGLAATGIVSLPSWIVESIIAGSIAIAALDNIVPIFGKSKMSIVFGFGLFHGLGFASVLGHLALSQTSLTKTMVAFNVGVEIGQLVIIFAIFPALFAVRKAKIYRPFILIGGSVVLIGVAVCWVIERTCDVTILGF